MIARAAASAGLFFMLRIELLGDFGVWRDEFPITTFHSQKAQSLLAYLIIYRDRAHSRSVLADLFWGESDEARAQANLRNALYSLRHALEGPNKRFGNYILTEGGAVRFNPKSEFSLDVSEFEEGLEQAQRTPSAERIALLQDAVALYQGELLPGFYDDWVLIEQEHLRELYLQALKELAAHYTEQKDYPQAIEWTRRALAANPLQEDLHRALMQLYVLTGDRTAAFQQYAECKAVLHRELNATPLPETQALHERLLKGRSLETTPPSELAPETPFVRRERELEVLNKLWANVLQGQGKSVFIGGEVGVGKTAFVQNFIRAMGASPLQGAAYAFSSELPYETVLQAVREGVRTMSTATLAQLPTLWRSELAQFVPELQERFPDLKPNPPLPPAQGKARWFAALTGFFELLARERPLMLFLDDLHWADDATLEYLSYLSAHLKNLKVLLIGTYRTEEALAESRLRTWLDKLGPGRSYQPLMLSCLSQEETGLWLEQWLGVGARQAVPLLYDKTEGNPLFLTGLVRSLVQSEALRPDAEGRWELVTAEIGAAYLPESLRELIGASLRRAPGRAQGLLGPAAVIGRAFELPVLREILHQSEEKLLDRLDELRWVGLIVEREGRYQFHHELTRQIVYESLSTDRRRLWHRKVGGALETLYPQRLDELSDDLARHFEQAHVWKKAIGYAERAGTHAQNIYAHAEAVRFFTKALELSQQIGDRHGQGEILNNIGKVYVGLGEYAEALRCYYQALQICQQSGDREDEGRSLNNIGVVHQEQGQYEEALRCYQQALSICRELGIRRGEGISLNNISNIYYFLGQYEEALAHHQQALKVRRELGDKRGESISLDNIGGVYQGLGRYDEALSSHQQALQIYQELGDRRGEGDTLENIGIIFVSVGKLQEAMGFLEQALEIRRKIEDRRGQGYCLHMLGHCFRDQGEPREALQRYQAARALFEELGLKAEQLLALSAEGVAHLELKELKQALTCSSSAVGLLEGGQICATPQEVYFHHFKVLSVHNRKAEALAYLEKAYDEVIKRAGEIKDIETREGFLKNVPINRQIRQAWQAAQRKPKSIRKSDEEPG